MRVFAVRGIVVSVFVLALVALALPLLSASEDSRASHTAGTPAFDPSIDVRLCNILDPGFAAGQVPRLPGTGPNCVQDGTPSGHPDLGTVLVIPAGDHNLGEVFQNGLRDFTLADHSAIPIGLVAGGLTSTTSLGVTANACSTTFFPEFIWFNATIDNSPANTFALQPEGTSNRFLTLANENPAVPLDGTGRDDDAPFGIADKDANIVTRYPDALNRFFDPDGDGIDTDGNPATIGDQPVQPSARYAGLTQVPAGGEWQALQSVVFDPGDLAAAYSANATTTKHPFAKLTSLFGSATITVLNDPTATISSVNPISDFCSPLGTRGMLLGQMHDPALSEDGAGAGTCGDTIDNGGGDGADADDPDCLRDRITAPASTGHMAQARTQSLRDADDDGIENAFDTCQWTPNTVAEDPYLTNGPDLDGGGNPAGDMLDSVCDPAPATNLNFGDQDGDGYVNNQDLCPLNAVAAPALQLDSEASVTRNAAAPDGGPQGDAIGDACDGVVVPLHNPAGLGNPTVADGGYFNEIHVDSVCIDPSVDNDDDGWCAADDPNDADPNVPGGSSIRLPSSADADGDDNQSGNPYTRASDSDEWAVGTDPLWDCSLITGHDTWPPDFNADGTSNILDIVQLTPPVFNSAPGNPNYIVRKDLNGDNSINILDIVLLTPPVFNTACSG